MDIYVHEKDLGGAGSEEKWCGVRGCALAWPTALGAELGGGVQTDTTRPATCCHSNIMTEQGLHKPVQN